MFTTRLRKIGTAWVVTVPDEEMEVLGPAEGATVTVELHDAQRADPVLAANVHEPAVRALANTRRGLKYLA